MARLLQVFLDFNPSSGIPNVYEVSEDADLMLSCTCATFGAKKACVHSRAVRSNKVRNGGTYKFDFVNKLKTDLPPPTASDEEFRQFVVRNTKPLVVNATSYKDS